MPAKNGCIHGRNQSEPRYTGTGAFCLSWSAVSHHLVGARMDAGDVTLPGLTNQLVNHIRSHIPGAFSP